ncbi:MAG: pyridoxamine 5'-phosphate oxidase family protein [Clostridiaceae bacterium]
MRRKDREMNREFGFDLIDRADYGVLSVVDGDAPLSVPLSMVRYGNYLYFHSAREGRKTDVFYDGINVTVVFVADVKVPELFGDDELSKIAIDESKFSVLVSSVFTTEFASVIVTGTLEEVLDEDEMLHALELVCKKYTPTKMEYFNSAVLSGAKHTRVYKVMIEELTSKRKKYAKDGHELKFMEEEQSE